MKKIIIKLVILTTLISSSVAGEPLLENDKTSLIGIEGAYNAIDISNDASYSKKLDFMAIGIKIGAQTDNYRLFLSARKNFIPNFNSYAFGAEMQYLMNFSSVANMFIGINTGTISFKFDDEASLSRDISSKYIGGDIGLNLHLSDSADLEIGTRTMRLREPSHLQGGVTYNLENITNVYVSLIFKYSMDDK